MVMKMVSRRNFLKKAALGSLSLAPLGNYTLRAKEARRKPNLLFILTDQQRFDTFAAYGNMKIEAPNLNRLARESIVFKRAYVTQPVCTPARSSIMTGLWPHTNGCISNNIPLRQDAACLPRLLNDPEYRSAYMGKWHLGDEVFRQHGFDEWVSIEDSYAHRYSEGRDATARSNYHEYLQPLGYEPDEENIFQRSFSATLPLEHSKPKFMERKAREFIFRNRQNPFILYTSFLGPHPPLRGPMEEKYKAEEMEMAPSFDTVLGENDPLRYRLFQEYFWDECKGNPDEYRKVKALYWGRVSQIDLSIGNLLATLEEAEVADNTIVVFTSEHGEMLGDHRILHKQLMYEGSSRIPFLLKIPQMNGRSLAVEHPVSQIDIIPTLLDLLGGNPVGSLPGQSLGPIAKGREVDEKHTFIQWNPAIKPPNFLKNTQLCSPVDLKRISTESVRTVVSPDHWKLCLSDVDKHQLFNLADDPHEMKNLYYTSRHKDTIRRLTKKIHQWQTKVKDKVPV